MNQTADRKEAQAIAKINIADSDVEPAELGSRGLCIFFSSFTESLLMRLQDAFAARWSAEEIVLKIPAARMLQTLVSIVQRLAK